MLGSREVLLQRMRAVVTDSADDVAVQEKSRQLTYTEFAKMVATYRAALQVVDPAGQSPIGLLLDRSAEAYAAMWAAIAEGRAYVPLNPRYPASRLRTIVGAAGVEYIFCGPALQDIGKKLGLAQSRVLVPKFDTAHVEYDEKVWLARRSNGTFAYILYTSGSTGKPKGVPISYDNLLSFIDNIIETIPYPPNSICSQVCELSFDVSVHEIYQALLSGCTLCPSRQIDLFNPGQFISENRISVWISVPSLARVILANQKNRPYALETIQLSIFNGEPLTVSLARDWQKAIPNAVVWNTYGPTECTVAVTAQPWQDRDDLAELDVVSIGTPLPGCEIAFLDEDKVIHLQSQAPERAGELLLKTAQCFGGYADPAIIRPFTHDANGSEFYKTGDKVLWRNGRLFHLGRLDHQVKVGGHRIELMEVEAQMRRVLETDALAVVTFPRMQPTELVLFVEGQDEVPRLTAETLGLPTYMLPKRSLTIEKLPVTAHGKLDRIALQSLLEEKEC